jgi:hypothetical protein
MIGTWKSVLMSATPFDGFGGGWTPGAKSEPAELQGFAILESITDRPEEIHPDETIVIRFNWDRLGFIVMAAAFLALAAVNVVPNNPTSRGMLPIAAPAGRATEMAGVTGSASAQLVVLPTSGTADELPLGIWVSGASAGATLDITGLPSGAKLSSGRRLSAHSWRLAATEGANTVIHLPTGYARPINMVVELRRADGTLADRRSVHRKPGVRPDVGTPRTV